MGALFFVAGAVYRCKDYLPFVCKKVRRILVPYFVFNLLSLGTRVLGGALVNQHPAFEKSLYDMLFRGGEYWFLYIIFIIFLVYPLLEKVFNEPWKEVALILALMTLGDIYPKASFLGFRQVMHYLPMFIVGKYAFSRMVSFRAPSKKWSLAFILVMPALWAVSNYYYKHALPLNTLLLFRAMSMTAVMFIIAYYLKEMTTSEHPFLQKTQNILGECSKYSLQIYLFDAFWMVAIRTVLINFLHITSPIVILFFMTTVNISCTLIACKYVLPKSKLLSWATGL